MLTIAEQVSAPTGGAMSVGAETCSAISLQANTIHKFGRHEWIRTTDLFHVKEAL